MRWGTFAHRPGDRKSRPRFACLGEGFADLLVELDAERRAAAAFAHVTSPAGAARRSTVMAAVTTAIARRSMTPMTRRIAVSPAQQ